MTAAVTPAGRRLLLLRRRRRASRPLGCRAISARTWPWRRVLTASARTWTLSQPWPAICRTHMWTAPAVQGVCGFDGSGRLRSYVRPVCAVGGTAGPDGFRGSGPEHFDDVAASLGPWGCPDPRLDRSPSRSILASARLVSG